MDTLSTKAVLTLAFFLVYAILLVQPLRKFIKMDDSDWTEAQDTVNPFAFARWLVVRIVLLFPLVGIQAL